MNGTMNVEKAQVNGAQVTREDKSALDALLEKVDLERSADEASFRIIDAKLSDEIVGTMRGHFAENLIYNIPRRTNTGRKEHRECDLMPNSCPYKGKQPHIHVLGVGIQGALTAMRAYGRIHADIPSMPEMVEHGDRLYWAAYAVATDGHTGNEYGRWYFEPVMRKAGNKNIENEFGVSIAQSKALRNVILALIPARLMESWIEDYKAGKKAFSAKSAKNMGYGPKPKERRSRPKSNPEPNQKSTSNVKTPGERDLDTVIIQLSKDMKVNADDLASWATAYYETTGKAMLQLNRAMNGEETDFNTIIANFNEWKAKQKGDNQADAEIPIETENLSKEEMIKHIIGLVQETPMKDVDKPGFKSFAKKVLDKQVERLSDLEDGELANLLEALHTQIDAAADKQAAE